MGKFFDIEFGFPDDPPRTQQLFDPAEMEFRMKQSFKICKRQLRFDAKHDDKCAQAILSDFIEFEKAKPKRKTRLFV